MPGPVKSLRDVPRFGPPPGPPQVMPVRAGDGVTPLQQFSVVDGGPVSMALAPPPGAAGLPVPQEVAMAPLSLPVNPDGGTPTPDGFAPVFDTIAQNNMDPTPDKDRSFKGKLLRGLQAIAPLLSGAASGMAIGGTSPNAAAAAGNAFNQMAVIQPMEQARLEMDREKHAYDLLKSKYDIKKTQADIGKTEEETRLMDPTFQMRLDASRSNSEYQMAQKALTEAKAETENLMRKANLEGKQLANDSTKAQIVLRKAQANIQKQLEDAGWGTIQANRESARIMQIIAQTSYTDARMDELPQDMALKGRYASVAERQVGVAEERLKLPPGQRSSERAVDIWSDLINDRQRAVAAIDKNLYYANREEYNRQVAAIDAKFKELTEQYFSLAQQESGIGGPPVPGGGTPQQRYTPEQLQQLRDVMRQNNWK